MPPSPRRSRSASGRDGRGKRETLPEGRRRGCHLGEEGERKKHNVQRRSYNCKPILQKLLEASLAVRLSFMFSLRNTSLRTKEKAVPRARSRPGASQPLVRKRGGGGPHPARHPPAWPSPRRAAFFSVIRHNQTGVLAQREPFVGEKYKRSAPRANR